MLQELCAKRTPPVIASALAFPKKSQPSILIHTAALPEPLRPFVQNLGQALSARGCKVTFFPSDPSQTADRPLACAQALAACAPYVVIAFNHSRASLQGAVPDAIPVISWFVDDALANATFGPGGRLQPLDLVVGDLRTDLAAFHALPEERSARLPVGSSTSAFHERPVSDRARAANSCLVACVSNDADMPDFLHATRLSKVRSSPELTRFYTDLYPALKEIAGSPRDAGPLIPRIREAIGAALAEHRLPDPAPSIDETLSLYAMPIVHRLIVHQTLEMVANLCAKYRWTFQLFGPGWSDHSTLADFAKGDKPSCEAARASFQCARAHLFFPPVGTIPSGLFQCAFSGGLPLMRLWPDNLSPSAMCALTDYVPDAESIAFHDRSSLERLLVRARSDEEWRSTLRTKLTARGLSKATPDALAQRLLTLATDHLAVCQLTAAA